mmetsp:Transcript_7459/g.19165  ORF Transcript_7459/g.19165 Transcript_7459/m.19165 type:complete len:231 (-) Transcript_7459:877-1569(-)
MRLGVARPPAERRQRLPKLVFESFQEHGSLRVCVLPLHELRRVLANLARQGQNLLRPEAQARARRVLLDDVDEPRVGILRSALDGLLDVKGNRIQHLVGAQVLHCIANGFVHARRPLVLASGIVRRKLAQVLDHRESKWRILGPNDLAQLGNQLERHVPARLVRHREHGLNGGGDSKHGVRRRSLLLRRCLQVSACLGSHFLGDASFHEFCEDVSHLDAEHLRVSLAQVV